MWTHQDVNVIRHYGEGVQSMAPLRIGGMMQDFHDHVCNGGLAEMQRTGTSFVQQAIQSGECSSRLISESGKTRFGGRLPCRRHVTKTGASI